MSARRPGGCHVNGRCCYAGRAMDEADHEEIEWLHTQLTGHVNGLSGIYEHISAAIRRLQDEKAELQSRVDQLEQDNPSAEVRRLREENSILRARLATAAKEKTEITWERDTLFRKLSSIKQLIDGSAIDENDLGTDAQSPVLGPPSTTSRTSTARPHLARTRAQPVLSVIEHISTTRTDISEPKTDVTTVHDTFGRVIRPQGARPVSTSARAPKPLPLHAPAVPVSHDARSQDAEPSTTHFGTPLADTARGSASPTLPQTSPALSPGLTSSPALPPVFNSSMGISEGLSLQYDDAARPVTSPAGIGAATVQKWRIHFAKPPISSMVVGLAKPVPTASLVENLELDDESKRGIEGLSSEPASSLRLYINDIFGLAFLYDPVFLESPEATYVVEWCEVKASQNTRAYITMARQKHTELHTFIYAPRKNGWHYLGQQQWNVVETKSIWTSLGPPAQNALAARSSQTGDPVEITRGLKRGQIEQLTIQLQQVSLIQPNNSESVLIKKLGDSDGQV
ncbi:hypothetical protein BC827DRAFT_393109 [Russula dissimulans]|nr:hypothetical protein BC827DRAFT_393109 [Russula dissimulans]